MPSHAEKDRRTSQILPFEYPRCKSSEYLQFECENNLRRPANRLGRTLAQQNKMSNRCERVNDEYQQRNRCEMNSLQQNKMCPSIKDRLLKIQSSNVDPNSTSIDRLLKIQSFNVDPNSPSIDRLLKIQSHNVDPNDSSIDRLLKIQSHNVDTKELSQFYTSRSSKSSGNIQTLPTRRKPKLNDDEFRHASDEFANNIDYGTANPSNHCSGNLGPNQPLSIIKTFSMSAGMSKLLSNSFCDTKFYPQKNNRESVV